MIGRFSLLVLALALLPLWGLSGRSAQDARVVAAFDAPVSPDRGAILAFSDDGQLLHAIGKSRAITYDNSGAVTNIVNLDPDTIALSNTINGRTAILATIAVGRPEKENHTHLVMLDAETGQRQEIPSSWYDSTDGEPSVEISGDGRLVSIYSMSDTDKAEMIVTVYDWATKALVAKRTSELIDAGGSFEGGVTVDGAIEFVNNRSGRKVVDLKTGALVGRFGYDSWRSPDGGWVIELPNLWVGTLPSKDVIIRSGTRGQTVGRLADVQFADEGRDRKQGAFCGTTGRFVLARGSGVGALARGLGAGVYAIPSGTQLASFPQETWQHTNAEDTFQLSVACSANGRRVAILSGTRLTFHELR